jgi:hypothetical protein
MEDTHIQIIALKGLFQQVPQPPSAVFELENWCVDPVTGGWINRIGYEKYDVNANDWSPFLVNVIDSMFYVQRHQGAQDSILFEQGGGLFQLNDFAGAVLKKQELSVPRVLPLSSEVGTQYAQFGRYVIYVNGYNRPAKSHLWPCTSYTANYLVELPLGFDALPPSPVVWGVETNPAATSTDGNNICIWFYADNAATIYGDFKDKGLGIPTNAKENKYRYKVSFVNTAGSESPLSSFSNTVEWATIASTLKYALNVEIPIGNEDIVARRIYRTKNFSADGGNDSLTYYFVAEIANNRDDIFIDDIPDTALGSLAPAENTSVIMPARKARFVGVYKDCLFLDGGRDDDLTLYFSNPARPDQYGAFSFITLGHRQGGGLTGLYSYFSHLLIFREKSIDIVQGDYPNFTSASLSQYVGTTATNTIVSAPGLGVVFLSFDGVYSVNINLDYSDSPNVQNVTPHLRDLFSRVNVDALAKASGVYSKKRRELIFSFPVDGSPVNNMVLVYHTDKKSWSTRDFPMGQMVVSSTGEVMFGMSDTAASSNDQHGIMVLSNRRAAGQTKREDTTVDFPPSTSILRSAWLDMGDASVKKKIHGVYLYMATGGNQDIPLKFFTDYDYTKPHLSQALRQQPADIADQPVYNVVQLDGMDSWQEPLVTMLRYDIYTQACSWFQFMIETAADMHVIGYAIDYTASGTRIIKGKKL